MSDNLPLDLMQAKLRARLEAVSLTKTHIILLNAMHDFYTEFNTHPNMRVFLNKLKHIPELKTELVSSIWLYSFFPKGLSQIVRLAGLPKSPYCIE